MAGCWDGGRFLTNCVFDHDTDASLNLKFLGDGPFVNRVVKPTIGRCGDRAIERVGGMSHIGTYFDLAKAYAEWREKAAVDFSCSSVKSYDSQFFDWASLDILEEASALERAILELNGLFLCEELLLAASAEAVWARMTSVMDSGAAESVIPEKFIDCVPLEASEGYQRGTTYTSASGQTIANQGVRTVCGMTNESLSVSAVYQVCAVNKPLTIVAKVC